MNCREGFFFRKFKSSMAIAARGRKLLTNANLVYEIHDLVRVN